MHLVAIDMLEAKKEAGKKCCTNTGAEKYMLSGSAYYCKDYRDKI